MIRLLLIYDVPGWACEMECHSIRKQLEHQFAGQFQVTVKGASAAHSAAYLSRYDLVFSTIYYHLAEAKHPRSVSQVSSYSYWIRTGWEGGWPHLSEWQWMIAKNSEIHARLTPVDHPRVRLLYHVLDPWHWRPREEMSTYRHPQRLGRPFRVGFAGHNEQALKGVDLIEQAVASLDNVELRIAGWSGRIPPHDMVSFYHELDAYVCMSRHGHDAGPRSPMEAALCGVPVITTDAGQAGEMFRNGENSIVIPRTVPDLQDAIGRLRDNTSYHRQLKQAARESLLDYWVWGVGREWGEYFKEIMECPSPRL